MWTEGGQPDHLTFAGLRGGGKGGSQQATTQQSGSTNTSGTSATQLPPWLTGAAQQAVGTAQTLSQNPNLFNPYPGQQVADISPLQQQALNYGGGSDPNATANQIGGAAGALYGDLSGANSGLTAQKQAIYGGLGNAASTIAGAQGNAAGLLGNFTGLGPATVGQVGAGAQSLMSPYISNVIGPSMQLGQQALAQNLQQIGAAANQAGAFGGSRQGVMEGVAQSQAALGESNLMANLLNTGWNAALQPSENVALQAGQEGYGAGNTLAQLSAQGGNVLAQLQAQGGANLGGYVQGDVGGSLNAAAGLPQQYLGNLDTLGQQQQSQQQAQLNAQMGNYYGAQQQPEQNLDVLLSALGGVPYGTSTSATGAGMSTGTGTETQTTTPGLMNDITGGFGLVNKGASLLGSF